MRSGRPYEALRIWRGRRTGDVMADLRELYQEVILDHSKNPRNFRKIDPADRHADGTNPLCGDRVSLFVKLDGGRIADVAFQGEGCAISESVASVVNDALKGKNE